MFISATWSGCNGLFMLLLPLGGYGQHHMLTFSSYHESSCLPADGSWDVNLRVCGEPLNFVR